MITKQKLEFLIKKHTLGQIALKFNVSPATISRRLKSFGIKKRNLARSEKMEKIQNLLKEGKKPKEVAKIIGCHTQTVHYYRWNY